MELKMERLQLHNDKLLETCKVLSHLRIYVHKITTIIKWDINNDVSPTDPVYIRFNSIQLSFEDHDLYPV